MPLGLDILATRAVVRDALSERSQKVAQLLLVWLVPLMGALVELAVHRAVQPPSRQYRETVEPGDAASQLLHGDD